MNKHYFVPRSYWPASGRLDYELCRAGTAQFLGNNLKFLLHTCENILTMLLPCNSTHRLYVFVFGSKQSQFSFIAEKKHFLQDGSQTRAMSVAMAAHLRGRAGRRA